MINRIKSAQNEILSCVISMKENFFEKSISFFLNFLIRQKAEFMSSIQFIRCQKFILLLFFILKYVNQFVYVMFTGQHNCEIHDEINWHFVFDNIYMKISFEIYLSEFIYRIEILFV